MTCVPVTDTSTRALRTVAVNGAYNASRALSKWLHRGVRLTCNGFRSVPIAEAGLALGDAETLVAAVHLPLAGDITGHMLLTFPEPTALALVDLIMQVPEGTATQFGELERSCLEETGNIVSTAYANSLSKWLDLHIEPRVPSFAMDMLCAILDPLLVDSARLGDEVHVASTEFLLDGKRFEWGFMLLPSHTSFAMMESRCDQESVRAEALRTIAVNGSFDASRAISKFLKRGVKISTDGFVRVAIDDVVDRFRDSDEILAWHLDLGAQINGHALLVMDDPNALRFADLILQQPAATTTTLGELEESALREGANIIASAFVNSWSNWLDIKIVPGAPQFVRDAPDAVIGSVLAEQAMVGDDVYLTQTDFIVDEQTVKWVFMLLPAPSAMRLIDSSLK